MVDKLVDVRALGEDNLMNSDLKKYQWLLSPLVTFLIFSGGIAVQWATTRAAVAAIQTEQQTVNGRVDTVEKKVQAQEVKSAETKTTVEDIRDDVKEIKQDIKSILRGKGK
jgi:peptidoglycan hydrolase CwlO-like protein